MARGKKKYRDVVSKAKNKAVKKKPRPKKTYSLFKNDNNRKRKLVNENRNGDVDTKMQKVDDMLLLAKEVSSESEDEIEDHMKQLRQTFTNTNSLKKSLAIDSSDDSALESENENINNTIGECFSEEEVKSDVLNEDDIVIDNMAIDKESDSDVSEVKETEQTNGISLECNHDIQENIEELFEEGEIDLHTEKEFEDYENSKDPFVNHLFYDLHENLLESLQSTPPLVSIFMESWQKLRKLSIHIPKTDVVQSVSHSEFSINEKKSFAPPGKMPKRIDKAANSMELNIKPQIINNLKQANKSLQEDSDNIGFTTLQSEIFSIINNYQDFYYPERTFENAEEIRFVYCLHSLNHILKTRTKIVHHNARLSKKGDVLGEFRDQGLIRPKILIIAPFKDAAYKIINMFVNILLPCDQDKVMNKLRFIEDYTGNELVLPKRNPKPEDYEQTFTGNSSDDFKIGITVTRKSLKLYADFYTSDIIIASPLGLRRIIGAEGEPERDYDFLASIEVLILDQTEIFLMQNWDHLLHILDHLHLQPKSSHGTDFSRVRTWSLNGWAKYYRQTLIFSAIVLPEINALFNKKCSNYAGKVKVVNPIEFGSIQQVVVQLPHVFHKFEAKNAAEAIDARFDFFVSKIVPQQKDSLMKQTLIFIPNYFDYVRVRNYFKREDIEFVQICEYSKENKVARARDMFFHGDAHFILYTERFHFFNRIRVKGIRHIVFYQPPNFPHFYYEMCNLMQESNMNKKIGNMSNMTVSVLYSKYDVHQLAAIVSTERVAKMVHSDRNIHMMVTGELVTQLWNNDIRFVLHIAVVYISNKYTVTVLRKSKIRH